MQPHLRCLDVVIVANSVEDDIIYQDPEYMQAEARTENVRAALPGPPPEHSFRIIKLLLSMYVVIH